MEYNQCQKDIIYYVVDYYTSSKGKLIPCMEVFEKIFNEKYTNLEIEENTRVLVSEGTLKPHSFHAYIGLTEAFKSNSDYKLFKNKKI